MEKEKARREAVRRLEERDADVRNGRRRGLVGELTGEELYELDEEEGGEEEGLTQEQLDEMEGMEVDA